MFKSGSIDRVRIEVDLASIDACSATMEIVAHLNQNAAPVARHGN
jgi:hypothetical protein